MAVDQQRSLPDHKLSEGGHHFIEFIVRSVLNVHLYNVLWQGGGEGHTAYRDTSIILYTSIHNNRYLWSFHVFVSLSLHVCEKRKFRWSKLMVNLDDAGVVLEGREDGAKDGKLH